MAAGTGCWLLLHVILLAATAAPQGFSGIMHLCSITHAEPFSFNPFVPCFAPYEMSQCKTPCQAMKAPLASVSEGGML